MGKALYIAEKPSVAQEFARALGVSGGRRDGYIESDRCIITWCYGHLVTMSYPEVYDPSLKKWSLETLPFLPEKFRYEIIPSSEKQFRTVSGLLAREDVDVIYVCTDSGREGEYIYRLVEMMSDPSVLKKDRRRVWIDSFTDEEIGRGIREAKPLCDYDHLSDSAFLRAKEDYLMGINFSRVLTLKYGNSIAGYRNAGWSAVAVGRVMTCVLGMVVRREREIRSFVKQPFYRVIGTFDGIEAEWKADQGSRFEGSPLLYKENGFKTRQAAEELIAYLKSSGDTAEVISVSRKTEKKNPPLLYNLAELQNDCSKMFRISPDQTLKIAQELYEKKLTTYPRTDARVLSNACAKVISGNLKGLTHFGPLSAYASEILDGNSWKTIGKSRYTDDKAITDHYAIIPTGAGLNAVHSLSDLSKKVYETIARRFLAIFYPPAVYEKTAVMIGVGSEHFYANAKELKDPGYLRVYGKNTVKTDMGSGTDTVSKEQAGEELADAGTMSLMKSLRKGKKLRVSGYTVKEGETSPPKRYTSGSIILAMENAGQLIEDESLREQIRGSGIGTSATRADILAKLIKIGYLNLNKKTQVITPQLLGEMVYDVVDQSIRPLLSAELTASWEKGLQGVADGSISEEEYLEKLNGFVSRRTNAVKNLRNQNSMRIFYDRAAAFYKQKPERQRRKKHEPDRTG